MLPCWQHSTVGCGGEGEGAAKMQSLSLAPVSHRWVGLLMWGTLLHERGQCCAKQKTQEWKMCRWRTRSPRGRAPVFHFFKYGEARSTEEAVFSTPHRAYWQMDVDYRQHAGDDHLRAESLCGDAYTRRQSLSFFFNRVNSLEIRICHYFPGRICYTFIILASSVHLFYKAIRVRSSWTEEAPGRQTGARGRFVVLEAKMKVVRCGWNRGSSSKFRQGLWMDRQQPEIPLALSSLSLLLYNWRPWVCLKWRVGDS